MVSDIMPASVPKELREEIKKAFLEGDRVKAETIAREALSAGIAAVHIVEEGFVPALKRMGELFETGEVFLPELMMAGDAMKAAMKVLEPELRKSGGRSDARPKIVLGTVEGDIHEIGKNIVGIMLETAGYEVIDLGMEVEAADFVKAAKEHDAAVIGASALLTTTMEHQKEIVALAKAAGLKTKIIVGGAPVTQVWADEIGADGYAEDAKDAVILVDTILHRAKGRESN